MAELPQGGTMRLQIIFQSLLCLAFTLQTLHSAAPAKAKPPLAEGGDGEYHFHLGMNHYTGLGGKPNHTLAARQFQLAASAGHARAQGQLGICLLKGRGVPKDHELALSWLTRAANRKDAIALYTLGNFHAQAEDYVKANKFYLQAAAQGHAAAMNNLGTSYEHGHGVPADATKAAKWYGNAARMNLAAAQCNLALMHATGLGVARDPKRALKFYRDAAGQGDVRAQFLLGAALHFGTLANPDRVEAAKWLQLAAHQGHAAARAHLAAVNGKLSSDQQKTVDKQVSTFLASATRSKNGAIGSGFFITKQGHLLTTYHLVARAESIEVLLRGHRHLARVLKTDSVNNLALLKIEAITPALTLITGRQLHLGLPVFTIGLPAQSEKNSGPKYSHGFIRKLTGRTLDPRQVQANLNVQPNHSGAPLLDSTGQAVGMLMFQLNELKAYRATGSLPHTLNTALKAKRIHAFLFEFPDIRRRMPRPLAETSSALANSELATAQILVQ